jgi:hypothetical protein
MDITEGLASHDDFSILPEVGNTSWHWPASSCYNYHSCSYSTVVNKGTPWYAVSSIH